MKTLFSLILAAGLGIGLSTSTARAGDDGNTPHCKMVGPEGYSVYCVYGDDEWVCHGGGQDWACYGLSGQWTTDCPDCTGNQRPQTKPVLRAEPRT